MSDQKTTPDPLADRSVLALRQDLASIHQTAERALRLLARPDLQARAQAAPARPLASLITRADRLSYDAHGILRDLLAVLDLPDEMSRIP